VSLFSKKGLLLIDPLTWKNRRPEHGMYEDIEPLFACALLPALAIALANDAFQDYHSVEEIFEIPPPIAGTVTPLRIKREMEEVPFFQTFDADGPTGKIEKATGYSSRHVNLGHRAGFPVNLTTHCDRREVLIKAAGKSPLALRRISSRITNPEEQMAM
jgi:hypothetical protein